MPARHFDRHRARAVRRAADRLQGQVGADMGVSDSAVANWETGHSSPDPEKLPEYAAALRGALDDLFPRTGMPDLADLRCDAGIYLNETAGVIGTKSAGPVSAAEKGVRRLKDRYVPALAARYGVSEGDLRRAEDRSFAAAEEKSRGAESGVHQDAAADLGRPPGSLAEKITLILQRSYPGPQGPPSDAEMAAQVNAQMGADILTAQDFLELRTGVKDTAPTAVLPALAAVVGVSPLYFESDDAVAAQVYEGLQLLAAAKQGSIGRVKARGLGPQGLSPRMMALVNELVAEMKEEEAEAGK
ncbi:helix-turn-helix domain-containing protein [Streptomyces sp. NPDC057099]|uniref:helix-turn-helix domain-containing protein n=1 Tax=Streptomyces sp. NPDC057099 TaxID=3346019 RepID=UPI00363800FC